LYPREIDCEDMNYKSAVFGRQDNIKMDLGDLCCENVNKKVAKWRFRRQDDNKSGPCVNNYANM
jgi:hypothetical protein